MSGLFKDSFDKNAKCLFFDFDGTLHNNGVTSPETIKALDYARSKGCYLFVNTGRTKPFLMRDLFKFTGYEFDGILCGGAAVYYGKNYEKVLFEEQPLTEDEKDEILSVVCKNALWTVFEGYDELYTLEIHGEVKYLKSELEEFYRKGKKDLSKLKISKCSVFPPKGVPALDKVKEATCMDWVEYKYYPWYEGYKKGCGKGKIIEKFCLVTGTNIKNTIAFGDSENDISAFESAAKSVAMNFAPEPLKSVATYVAKTAEGVSEGIYHYIK